MRLVWKSDSILDEFVLLESPLTGRVRQAGGLHTLHGDSLRFFAWVDCRVARRH
jgi:hypothetical protein